MKTSAPVSTLRYHSVRCILGGPHPTLGVDSEGSAVFRDTVFEAFRRLAPFFLHPDHFASHDDVGEAIVVHARDAAGVVEEIGIYKWRQNLCQVKPT